MSGPYRSPSCYKFVLASKTWAEAETSCKSMEGYLATLETEEEIIWIKGYRSYHKNLHDWAWVGGYKKNNQWYWKTPNGDTQMQVADWGEGEPNGGSLENCLSLFPQNSQIPAKLWFQFNDGSCNFPTNYICEKQKSLL